MIDFEDRWIYLGSSTLPPCTKLGYWNIPRIVYPVEMKYMSLFKMQFRTQFNKIKSSNNARKLQVPDGNEIYHVGALATGCSVVVLLGTLLYILE